MKNRDIIITEIESFLIEKGYEVLRVPLSDSSTSDNFRLAIPTLDDNSVEATVSVAVATMKKRRDGTDYDAYEEHERYKEQVALCAERRKRAEENKKKKSKKKGGEEE